MADGHAGEETVRPPTDEEMRDTERLVAENAALREELAAMEMEIWWAERWMLARMFGLCVALEVIEFAVSVLRFAVNVKEGVKELAVGLLRAVFGRFW